MGDIANGVGCLIAQFIKDKKDCVGDLYIYPIGEGQDDCDYNYSVVIEDTYSRRKVKDITTIEVNSWGEEPFFKGSIQELLDYIENQKEEQ